MRLNSVIFHTSNLKQIKSFYTEVLGLQVSTYKKDGKEVPDESANYVNFKLGESLLCFEVEGDRMDLGTVVLNVPQMECVKHALARAGAKIIKESPSFLIAADPDGRELIFEPIDLVS